MKKLTTLISAAALTVASLPALGASQWIVENNTTKSECSDCHMAYAPGFLPERSWLAIMNNLSDHFGEDASLGDAARQEISNYLVAVASKEVRGVSSVAVPLRITDLRWFRGEHGSRQRNRAENNPNIGSISNCTGCHRGAERGYFDDD
jgi:hypothetical protein